MTTIECLPTELLLQAFIYLSVVDLRYVSSCSRTLHPIANELMYTDIALQSSRHLCSLARTILGKLELAPKIRSLKFTIFPHDELDANEIGIPLWKQAFLNGTQELGRFLPDVVPYLFAHEQEHKTWAGMLLLLASNLDSLEVKALKRKEADFEIYDSGMWWCFGDGLVENRVNFLARLNKLHTLRTYGFQPASNQSRARGSSRIRTTPMLVLSTITTLVVGLHSRRIGGSVSQMCHGLDNLRHLGLQINNNTSSIRSFCCNLQGLQRLHSLHIYSKFPAQMERGPSFHMPLHTLLELRETSGPATVLGPFMDFPKNLQSFRVWGNCLWEGSPGETHLYQILRDRTLFPNLQSIGIHCGLLQLGKIGPRICRWSHQCDGATQVKINFFVDWSVYDDSDLGMAKWTGIRMYNNAKTNHQLLLTHFRTFFGYTMTMVERSSCSNASVCYCYEEHDWMPTKQTIAYYSKLNFHERVPQWLKMFFMEDTDGHESMARIVLPYLAAFSKDWDEHRFNSILASMFNVCQFDPGNGGIIRGIRARSVLTL